MEDLKARGNNNPTPKEIEDYFNESRSLFEAAIDEGVVWQVPMSEVEEATSALIAAGNAEPTPE